MKSVLNLALLQLLTLLQLTIVSLFLAAPVHAKGDAELDAFFNSYVSSYATYFDKESGGDISVIMEHFLPKTLQVPPNAAPRVTPNREALSKGFSFFVNMLEKKGAVGIRWESVQYVKLGESHALASNIANIYNKENDVIDRRSSVYSLYKTEQGWQIFMIQSIKPEQTPIIKPRL